MQVVSKLVKKIGAVVIVVAAALGGGAVLWDRLEGGDGGVTITEAEHDRLVEACVAEGEAPADCLTYVADLVEQAEAQGISYAELAGMMDDEFEKAAQEKRAREEEADRAQAERAQRDLEDLERYLDEQAAQECAERHGRPCDEIMRVRDEMAVIDCLQDLNPNYPTIRAGSVLSCRESLNSGTLIPRECQDNDTNGAIDLTDHDRLYTGTDLETVPCS